MRQMQQMWGGGGDRGARGGNENFRGILREAGLRGGGSAVLKQFHLWEVGHRPHRLRRRDAADAADVGGGGRSRRARWKRKFPGHFAGSWAARRRKCGSKTISSVGGRTPTASPSTTRCGRCGRCSDRSEERRVGKECRSR